MNCIVRGCKFTTHTPNTSDRVLYLIYTDRERYLVYIINYSIVVIANTSDIFSAERG